MIWVALTFGSNNERRHLDGAHGVPMQQQSCALAARTTLVVMGVSGSGKSEISQGSPPHSVGAISKPIISILPKT